MNRFRLLKYYLCVLVILISSHQAFAGTSFIDFPNPTVECEFFLSGNQATGAQKWVQNKVSSVHDSLNVFLDYSPTSLAIKAIGLDSPLPDPLVMTIAPDKLAEGLYRIKLIGAEGLVKSYALHIPPVLVWKLYKEDGQPLELDLTLESEDPRNFSLGVVTSETESYRTFISLSNRNNSQFLTVTIGIDVDCAKMSDYTQAIIPQYVFPSNDNDGHLCRIGVLKTHFQMTQDKKTPLPPRRGGHVT